MISNLWIIFAGNASGAQQITSLNMPLASVTESPSGKLLANSGGKIWAFTKDGKQRGLFTDLDRVGTATSCGPLHGVEFEPERYR